MNDIPGFVAARDFLKDFPVYRQEGWRENGDDSIPFLLYTLIFGAIVYIWEHYLNRRQLENFIEPHDSVPVGLEGVKMETFKKSLVYGADKISFDIQENRFMFMYGMILTIGGFLPWIWDFSESMCVTIGLIDAAKNGVSSIYREACITCIMVFFNSLHDTVISMPLDYYKTFVIEQQHGFNKSTVGLWLKDKVISLVLIFVLGSPVVYGIVWLSRTCGSQFPLYVWGFLLVVGLVMMAIYPTLIAPLFNKYEELEDGKLKDSIVKLAKNVEFPLAKLYTMDGSKRSGHSNAFFYGFGKSKMIVLFDTLISQCTQAEYVRYMHELQKPAFLYWHY